ncbi:hypothetical protein [Acetobacter sp.]|uniref:hypothetical protein n=1 Tax=Acetobacter sp. TaxID=440 RepID=UPI0025BCF6FB|nr:hypothetical protein [Acetobacter sp.]MCH4090047.1 hypothetical protein [Acetobacter sp.]MCI1298743.1 hypothetical protein [Acetobacter sp.]MCI1315308.1 hypothetical protein [Acetobacter sp.]
MVILNIEPIITKSSGGWPVKITGIAPCESDFIIGIIDTPAMGSINGRWNDVGLRSGGNMPDDSLDITDPEIMNLIHIASKLK